MKQFLLFAGFTYYPRGGMQDLHDTYETEEEARTAGKALVDSHNADWYHISDTETGDYFS